MPNKAVITQAGGLLEKPAGQFLLGSALVMESIPSGVSEIIPTGYQLQVYGSLDVAGTLDIQGKLVLL